MTDIAFELYDFCNEIVNKNDSFSTELYIDSDELNEMIDEFNQKHSNKIKTKNIYKILEIVEGDIDD